MPFPKRTVLLSLLAAATFNVGADEAAPSTQKILPGVPTPSVHRPNDVVATPPAEEGTRKILPGVPTPRAVRPGQGRTGVAQRPPGRPVPSHPQGHPQGDGSDGFVSGVPTPTHPTGNK